MRRSVLAIVFLLPVVAFAAERPDRLSPAVRVPVPSPDFLDDFLAPEIARQTEGYSYFVGSSAYGVHREAESAGHFETVAGIERNTIRAVRRAARDWLLEASGLERFTLTFQPFADAVERVEDRLIPDDSQRETKVRLGFSRLYPRVVVERPISAGAFRLAATLDGRAEAEFTPDSRYVPTVGAEWDTRERTARFRLGLAF